MEGGANSNLKARGVLLCLEEFEAFEAGQHLLGDSTAPLAVLQQIVAELQHDRVAPSWHACKERERKHVHDLLCFNKQTHKPNKKQRRGHDRKGGRENKQMSLCVHRPDTRTESAAYMKPSLPLQGWLMRVDRPAALKCLHISVAKLS